MMNMSIIFAMRIARNNIGKPIMDRILTEEHFEIVDATPFERSNVNPFQRIESECGSLAEL